MPELTKAWIVSVLWIDVYIVTSYAAIVSMARSQALHGVLWFTTLVAAYIMARPAVNHYHSLVKQERNGQRR